jgi:ABC-type multidrug transport system fused ATPase/permease subunit
VVLARAIATDSPVLVLVEPTSAVDAHTEAQIAERVADVRRGRTTVVTTVSPLWLHHADRIVLVDDNQATAEGTHEDLLLDSPAYRRVVTRAMESEGGGSDPVSPDLETVPARRRGPSSTEEVGSRG